MKQISKEDISKGKKEMKKKIQREVTKNSKAQ